MIGLCIGLLAASRTQAPTKTALVICVSDQGRSFVPADRKLTGPLEDAKNMCALFKAYGYVPVLLLDGNATKKNVDKALDDAKASQSVAVYFSGRGSWAPPAAGSTDKRPTLLLADSEDKSPSHDLFLDDLAAYSRSVKDSWIIVDAGWTKVKGDKSYEARPMKVEQRFWEREVAGTTPILKFTGLGGIWLASDFAGTAYDWKTASPDEYSGAFSSTLAWTAARLAATRPDVTLGDLQVEVNAYFAGHSDENYLNGERPVALYTTEPMGPLRRPETETFRHPLLGGGFNTQALAPQVRSVIENRAYRVALGFDYGEWTTETRNKFYVEFASQIRASGLPIRVVPIGSGSPDCVLSVGKCSESEFKIALNGGPRERAQHPTPFGPGPISKLLDPNSGSLYDALRCNLALKRLADYVLSVPPSSGNQLTVQLKDHGSGIFARGDRIILQTKASTAGHLFVVDIGTSRPYLDLPFSDKKLPQVVNNRLDAGEERPFFQAGEYKDSWVMSPGTGQLACILLEGDSNLVPEDNSDRAVADLADRLLEEVKKPGTKWSVKHLPYVVRP